MIYFILFWEFLKIAAFSFGGAYGAIPVIRDAVLNRGWMTEEMFGNIAAISESTPGPIMVNMATYIGSRQDGVLGAACATLGVVLPSFIIILFVAMIMQKILQNRLVQGALGGVKPAVVGIILTTGVWMAVSIISPAFSEFDYKTAILIGVLILLDILWQVFRKKEFNPILLIVVSAAAGMALFA